MSYVQGKGQDSSQSHETCLFLISGPIYSGGQRGISNRIPFPVTQQVTRTKPLSHFLKHHWLQKGHAGKRCQGTLAVTLSHMMPRNGNPIQARNLNTPSYLALLSDTSA